MKKNNAQNTDSDIVSIDQLIRCKDCVYWDEDFPSGRKSLGNYRCVCGEWSGEDVPTVYTGPEEFCSRAEKRE